MGESLLLGIPIEVLTIVHIIVQINKIQILSYMNGNTLGILSMTCKHLNIATQNEKLWERVFRKEFGELPMNFSKQEVISKPSNFRMQFAEIVQIRSKGRRFRSQKDMSQREKLVRQIIVNKKLAGTTQQLKLVLVGDGASGYSFRIHLT